MLQVFVVAFGIPVFQETHVVIVSLSVASRCLCCSFHFVEVWGGLWWESWSGFVPDYAVDVRFAASGAVCGW